MNYKNNDDLRNKKYIEQIQKKINIEKAMNKINQEIKKDETNILNEQRKKRFKKIMERKNNNFLSLVKDAFNEHNKINKKLSNLIEIDKKTYENDFNSMK
jgi:beta-N-acetylglucosaminidase